MAKVHGDDTALAWLSVQLRSVDSVRGVMAFGDEALHEAKQLIFAKYHSVAVVLLLEFFALYKMGEFEKETERVGGIQKVMVALGIYMRRAQDEANKLIYERELEEDYRRRMSYVTRHQDDHCAEGAGEKAAAAGDRVRGGAGYRQE